MIYLDHAAATPLDKRVKRAMDPFWEKHFANPSSLYAFAKTAREAVDSSRRIIANILGAKPREIIFTGSGTEANNLAILGIARKFKKGHIITTQIEHESVLEPCGQLEKEGFAVTYLPVDLYGFVNPENVRRVLRSETILVSIMYANNEIGTIEPISEIAKEIKKWKIENRKNKSNSRFPLFHTDACQAAGYLGLNVEKLGVDLLTINGSKIYGPKGVGILYKRNEVELEPIIYGGGQEEGMRSGTENVPVVVGIARALEIAKKEKDKESKQLATLRDYFIREILSRISGAVLNGPNMGSDDRLPNNINFTFPGLDAERAILELEKYGIYASSGSACSAREGAVSHVLKAIGRSQEMARSALRFSLGRGTTKKDLNRTIEMLLRIMRN